MIWLLAMLASIHLASQEARPAYVLATSPLTVTAICERTFPDAHWASYKIHVDLAGTPLDFHADSRGKALKQQTEELRPRLRDKYLFIPKGGDGGNGWRNRGWVVIKLGNKPRFLGFLSGGALDGEFSPYQHGLFRDCFDKLEINPLTSHAAAPGFAIWMREKGGRLLPLLDRTWDENARQWEDSLESLDRTGPETNSESRISALLYCAALAKWCGRQGELRLANARAHAILELKSQATFDMLISQVQPGELPDQRAVCKE